MSVRYNGWGGSNSMTLLSCLRKQVSRESIYSNILPQHDLEFRLFPVCGSSDTSDALLGQSGGHTGQAAACRTWPRPTQSHPAAPELLQLLLPAQVTETADSRLEVN